MALERARPLFGHRRMAPRDMLRLRLARFHRRAQGQEAPRPRLPQHQPPPRQARVPFRVALSPPPHGSRMARRGDWVFSIDLQDAYHHLGVHEDDQRYFTFALQTEEGTEYFSTSALSFGWCMSPFYFTQMLMARLVHRASVPDLFLYLGPLVR